MYKASCNCCQEVIEANTMSQTVNMLAVHLKRKHPEFVAQLLHKHLQSHCLAQLDTKE